MNLYNILLAKKLGGSSGGGGGGGFKVISAAPQGSYTPQLDKTFNEIKAAVNGGSVVFCERTDSEYKYYEYLISLHEGEGYYEVTFFNKNGSNAYYASDADGILRMGD